MISRAMVSAFPNVPQGMHMFPAPEDNLVISHSVEAASSQSTSLLFNLSILKDKLTQVQTLAGVLISQGHGQTLPDPTCSAIASMNSIVQEFIVTASSMMLTCQHMLLNLSPPPPAGTTTTCCTDDRYCNSNTNNIAQDRGQSTVFSSSDQNLDWFGGESYDNNNNIHYDNNNNNMKVKDDDPSVAISETNNNNNKSTNNYEGADIIEVDVADLLAKYTHYCQICGKGFKRDANLRMHMRAHGDEYKSSAALSNPVKNRSSGKEPKKYKYSCPQEGCRWNKKHARFQPLKSMICVKNHYKRSHCPKMYVCKRCNLKQFSVLSDLRTHEKHCGDIKWQCSCGTTFSRKDKLMGHVGLFVGHAPAVTTALSCSLDASNST